MFDLTVEQFLALTDGTVVGRIDPNAVIRGCVIDSRLVEPGDLFFGLGGGKQHGADFSAVALKQQATAVVVGRVDAERCSTPHIVVGDAEYALAQVANHNRRQSDALVVGVTGSVGKTTTRRMLSSVFESAHTGIQSPRNFNNQLGVPLSLLELQAGDEFAMIEVGASEPGEIEFLASVVQPDMAVLTRIAPSHLSRMQSLKVIQEEKAQLLKALRPDGIAFLNADDRLVIELAKQLDCEIVTFGTSNDADIYAKGVESNGHTVAAEVNGVRFEVSAFGSHHLTSILAAIAVGQTVGLSDDQIQSGLQTYVPQSGRCEILQTPANTVINDSYNSSPASVAAAMTALEECRDGHRRVIVLGDMLDLGEQSAELHYGVGVLLADSKIDHVVVTGQYSEDLVEGFRSNSGSLNRISQFNDLETLRAILPCLVSDDDAVLVKGSRGARMERVVEMLAQQTDDAKMAHAA